MSDVFREIKGTPILWNDGKVIHRVEGGWGPGDVGRILWTDCEKDVPANKAHLGGDKVTCAECISSINALDVHFGDVNELLNKINIRGDKQ